ncbi:hypothetical protein VBJ22_23730 [Enterobacter hormaechei]|nr:hypothetical protein [Enterobacter hormaechei]
MQATNQLLALQAKQSIQAQQLQITQDRAASLELARQAAATERAREVRRRFFTGQTGPDEYRTLAELPPIPASFDTPTDDAPEGDASLAAAEDTP